MVSSSRVFINQGRLDNNDILCCSGLDQEKLSDGNSVCPEIKPSVFSDHQIFINHRGSDTKNTLASLLYEILCRLALRVFLDRDEFKAGDFVYPVIEAAIKSSFVYIAIFSPRYAESEYCMNELCLMLEQCCDSSTKTIILVFWDVKPSDLENVNTGKYAAAFNSHKKARRVEVNDWEKALKTAAGIAGHEFVTAEGEWGKLAFKIVDTVLEKVRKEPLWVAEHPVGLEEAAKKLYEDILQLMEASAGITIVGLAGLDGSGKTALVTHLFNSKPDKFKKFSFLYVDSENQSKLTTLQEKLLFDLLGFCPLPVWDTKNGASLIRERLKVLSQAQVMIVLNGVDSQEQIDNLLLPVKDVLGKGSLILITSRDKDLLGHCQVIYNKKLLDEKEAEELIRQYAFHTSSVLTVSEDLVRKMMKKCGGYPFAVKVLAGQLSGKKEIDWIRRLKMLEKAQFPNEIFEKIVKPNYNSLHKEAKMVLLELAFLFEGLDMDLVVRFHPEVDCRFLDWIEPLGQKCLVEVDWLKSDWLEAHDEHYLPIKHWLIPRGGSKHTSTHIVCKIGMNNLIKDVAKNIGSDNGDLYKSCTEDQMTSLDSQISDSLAEGTTAQRSVIVVDDCIQEFQQLSFLKDFLSRLKRPEALYTGRQDSP